MSSSSSYESSFFFELHGMLATSTSYVNKSSSILLNRLTSVTPPDGAWTEYVSGGETLLDISSTKHKERPLRVALP
ncbi:hypothetical protein Tco_0491379 [Tanacetum coccineum]